MFIGSTKSDQVGPCLFLPNLKVKGQRTPSSAFRKQVPASCRSRTASPGKNIHLAVRARNGIRYVRESRLHLRELPAPSRGLFPVLSCSKHPISKLLGAKYCVCSPRLPCVTAPAISCQTVLRAFCLPRPCSLAIANGAGMNLTIGSGCSQFPGRHEQSYFPNFRSCISSRSPVHLILTCSPQHDMVSSQLG